MNCGICSSPTRRVFDLRSQRHDVTVPVMRCKACYAYSSDGGPVKYDDHSRVFDNAAFRTFGLDDGYCFMKTRGELR